VGVHTTHTSSALTCSPHLEGSASSRSPHGATKGQEGDARVGPPYTLANTQGGQGGFLLLLGGGSYRIRILMYLDVFLMYPACIQIHDTQDTITIQVRYMRDTFKDTHKIRISSPTCDRAWIPPNPRDTCPACIPHVFRMYPACILITSEDTCISHVSCTYPACLLHIRYISLWMHLRYMYLIMYLGCIPHIF